MKIVYMVCGVPGSGKTWVCTQLTGKFHYIPNDSFIGRDMATVINRSSTGTALTDCPFGERELKHKLERMGWIVKPYFIVEPASVVSTRYLKREGRPASQAILTRAETIKNKVQEWGAPSGTSEQILKMLKEV